ncbi:MAG TPA: sigma-70 family RNA polymerase sigma factor [Acidimicrobiales bacterium]|nr:sigma-70 family RNA polymerase sigma factor [Acidimicrobiales bacterium]
MDDRTLFARAAGDVDAFETLYRRYVARVTAYAATRCSCAADVADVVAQTFVRLLSVADRYDAARGEPIAFLLSIAGSVIGDHHRSRERDRRLLERVAGRELLDTDESERIEAAIDAARAAGEARDAVRDAPAGERDVLELVAAGASPAEAAAALGISPTNARVRLHRSRRRIQSRLAVKPEEA